MDDSDPVDVPAGCESHGWASLGVSTPIGFLGDFVSLRLGDLRQITISFGNDIHPYQPV
jgi:hypothetical protein